MAKERLLTIALMKGGAWVKFKDVSNHSMKFESRCGNLISVERSTNGMAYTVRTNVDHIRVYTTIVTPDDFPTLYYWDGLIEGYGWWQLEGFPLVEFGKKVRSELPDGIATADDIANNDVFGDESKIGLWG